jgi:hypothetical protein
MQRRSIINQKINSTPFFLLNFANLLITINTSASRSKVIIITSRPLNHLATTTDMSERAEGAPLFSPLHHRSQAKLVVVELVVVDKREVVVLRPIGLAHQSNNHCQK